MSKRRQLMVLLGIIAIALVYGAWHERNRRRNLAELIAEAKRAPALPPIAGCKGYYRGLPIYDVSYCKTTRAVQ